MALFNQTQVTSQKELDLINKFVYPDEEIVKAYKGLRDMVAITNKRVINIDKKGATGKNKFVESVRLNSIFNVHYQFDTDGINSHDILVEYILSPNLKAINPQTAILRIKLSEKSNDFKEVYQYLAKIAEENFDRINK